MTPGPSDSPDIVGLGLATLDVLIRVGDMPTWERGGSVAGFGLDGGGMVGTACVAAARLGTRVGYIGTAGSDLAGELKVRTLSERGVDVSRVVRRPGAETAVVIVYVHEETGERVFVGLRGFSDSPVRQGELDREYITGAEFLHLDGFHGDAALQAARWMREAGRRVAIDCSRTDGGPVSPKLVELLSLVDVLICGSGFGRALTGREDLWEAGRAMLDHGPTVVVQTEGADGCYTTTAEESFHTPAFQVEVLDTTGAGDVFHGAYLVGLLNDWSLPSVAQFASAVAAIKCAKLGGREGIPTLEETVEFLERRGIYQTFPYGRGRP